MEAIGFLDNVHSSADLRSADGIFVTAYGRYAAVPFPVRGGSRDLPADRAVIVLNDGTPLWLEPLDQQASVRAEDERRRLDGVLVRVHGLLHRVMPSIGQGVLEPCLTEVRDLEPMPDQ